MFRDLYQHAKFMSTVVYSQTQFIRTLWGPYKVKSMY